VEVISKLYLVNVRNLTAIISSHEAEHVARGSSNKSLVVVVVVKCASFAILCTFILLILCFLFSRSV